MIFLAIIADHIGIQFHRYFYHFRELPLARSRTGTCFSTRFPILAMCAVPQMVI
jgi:hypothetical protein